MINKLPWAKWILTAVLMGIFTIILEDRALAQVNASIDAALDSPKVMIDTLWVIIASIFIFCMNAGFAMLESGLCRRKNTVNVLTKNLLVFSIAALAFWSLGFGIMFGDGNPFFGTQGFFLAGADSSPLTGDAYRGVFDSLSGFGIPLQAKFFMHLMFAGVAAKIIAGAMVGRLSFFGYFSFSFLLVAIAYPVVGHWIWGGGFLSNMGFADFAGSTVVHSVGGWAALVGTIILGPRVERVRANKLISIPGHNMSLATLGCLILWLGWFGFNGGSFMAMRPAGISHVIVTTNLAGATGAVSAVVYSWLSTAKPNLISLINGSLAGLVAITAGSAYVSIPGAAFIGLIGGVVVIVVEDLLVRFNIDDPVGAVPVHLGAGIWGTFALGLFSVGPGVYPWYGEGEGPGVGFLQDGTLTQLGLQTLGIVVVAIFTIAFSIAAWMALEYTLGLRVSAEAEKAGLDRSEHGLVAYPEFERVSVLDANLLDVPIEDNIKQEIQ
ncbi:MAG: ammonium transporter [Cyanobacteria bacterium P01_F01_bin.150]